jgi:hypothetical protein
MNDPAPAEEVKTTPEAPVAEDPVETADEPVETVAEERTEEQKAAKDEKSANRFTKQTRELREAQRLIAELKAKLEPAEPAPLTVKPEMGNDVASKAPKAEDYRYGELDPQYMQDIADYRADLRIEAFRKELAEQNQAAQQATAAQREAAALREKAEQVTQAGSSKYADFNEVVVQGAQNQEWTLTKEMFELAAETSVPADVLYHLASNPEEADRVATLPLAQQALWFGRMEAKLATPDTPPARKLTQAPEPMASVRGSGSRATVPDDTDDLDAFSRKFFKRA